MEQVYPKEKAYFVISLIVSLIIYLLLIVSIVGIVYLIFGIIIAFVMQGFFIGNLKGNGIKISENQFPEIYSIAQRLSNEMDLIKIPDIYVIESGGLINAFATKFLGRNFVVLYSDVLELAYEEGEETLAFVMCHELAHIKRKHLSKRWILYPSMFVPFLGTAYSRACEYTCDIIGANYIPKSSVSGLIVLAAGKKLYQKVNVQELINQSKEENGFWVWFSEKCSTHPNITKRVRHVFNIQGRLDLNFEEDILSDTV